MPKRSYLPLGVFNKKVRAQPGKKINYALIINAFKDFFISRTFPLFSEVHLGASCQYDFSLSYSILKN